MIQGYKNIFENFYKEEKYIKGHHDIDDLLVWLIRNYSNLLYMIKIGEDCTDTFEKLALETTEIYINLLKMVDIDIKYPLEVDPEEVIIDNDVYEAVLSNLTTISLLLTMRDEDSVVNIIKHHHQTELTNLLYILL